MTVGKRAKTLLNDLRDICLLTVAVFIFYEILWFVIIGRQIDFWGMEWTYRGGDFLFCLGYCLVSYILSIQLGNVAHRRLNSTWAKTFALTIGVLIVNCLWAWLYAYIVNWVTSLYRQREMPYTDVIDLYGVAMISTLVISMMLNSRYILAYIKERTLREREKDVARDAAIRNLQLQISPHFLFNNLSALSSFVYTDPNKADDFIRHLSMFYRHTLKNLPTKLIPISEELEELKDYLYLLNSRFEDSVLITVCCSGESLSGQIPPGSIQLLVENCIKHNRYSRSEPLHISILCDGRTVTVSNDLRPMQGALQSFEVGHKNLHERFRLLDSPDITIKQEGGQYVVTIPLIPQP